MHVCACLCVCVCVCQREFVPAWMCACVNCVCSWQFYLIRNTEIDERIPHLQHMVKSHGQVCEQDSSTWLLLVTDHKWVCCLYHVLLCVCVCVCDIRVSESRQSLSCRMRGVIFILGWCSHCLCDTNMCQRWYWMCSSLNCHLYMFVAISALPSQLCGCDQQTSVLGGRISVGVIW